MSMGTSNYTDQSEGTYVRIQQLERDLKSQGLVHPWRPAPGTSEGLAASTCTANTGQGAHGLKRLEYMKPSTSPCVCGASDWNRCSCTSGSSCTSWRVGEMGRRQVKGASI